MKNSIIILLFICLNSSLFSEEVIKLNDLISKGLEHNFNLKISKNRLKINQALVQINEGSFAPYIDFNLASNNGNDPTYDHNDLYQFDFDFVYPTKYGIDFDAGASLNRTSYLDGSGKINNTGIWVGVTIPLLRGLGNNNNTFVNLKSSELEYEAQNYNLLHQHTVLINNIANVYIELANKYNLLSFYIEKTKEIGQYKNDIKTLIDKDEIPAAESLKAESFYNEMLINQNNAEQEFLSSLNDLNVLLGTDYNLNSIRNINFIDAEPDISAKSIEDFSSEIKNNLDQILNNKNDLLSQLKIVESSGIKLKGLENEMSHKLDLGIKFYDYGLNTNKDISEIISAYNEKLPGSSINMTLSYLLPISNNVKEGQYLEQKIDLENQQIQLELLKFTYKQNILKRLKDLSVNNKLLEIQRKNVDLFEKIYNNELLIYKLDQTTQLDVINTQKDYIDQKINYENLKTKLGISLIEIKFMVDMLPTDINELNQFKLWNMN